MRLLGDDIVPKPQVVTNHAITIDAPRDCVWPWLVQMGWRRAGWYTAYWIDKAAIPAELAQCKPHHPRAAAHISSATPFPTGPRRPSAGSSWRSWSPVGPWRSTLRVVCR